MNGSYIAVLVLIFVVIIPWINQKKRLAVIKHIKNKKYNKENNAMKELAKQFIGKECIIYTVTGTDSVIKGIVKEVTDGGIVVEKKTAQRRSIWNMSRVSANGRATQRARKSRFSSDEISGKSLFSCAQHPKRGIFLYRYFRYLNSSSCERKKSR